MGRQSFQIDPKIKKNGAGGTPKEEQNTKMKKSLVYSGILGNWILKFFGWFFRAGFFGALNNLYMFRVI